MARKQTPSYEPKFKRRQIHIGDDTVTVWDVDVVNPKTDEVIGGGTGLPTKKAAIEHAAKVIARRE